MKPISILALCTFILAGMIFFFANTEKIEAAYQVDGDIVEDSPGVCTPNSGPDCRSGPSSKKFRAPDNAIGVHIDVYWVWSGHPDSVQPNEHSYARAASGGGSLGRVYCQDFGDGLSQPQFCGRISGDVNPGDQLVLTIQHADDSQGPTSGSHRQLWVINWLTTAQPATNTPGAVLPPTETPAAAPTDTETPAVAPTETAAATPSETPAQPADTPTPGDATPTGAPSESPTPPAALTDTPVAPTATNTPITPEVEQTLQVRTPTATQQADTPEPRPTRAARTATATQPAAQGAQPTTTRQPQAQAATATATTQPPTMAPPAAVTGTATPQIVPQTGVDLAMMSVQVELFSRLLVRAGLVLFGLALVVLGMRWKQNKM